MNNKRIARELLLTAKKLVSRFIEDTVGDHDETKVFYKWQNNGNSYEISINVWYNEAGDPIEAIPKITTAPNPPCRTMWEEDDFMKGAEKNRKDYLKVIPEIKKYAKGLEDLHDYIKELEKKHG